MAVIISAFVAIFAQQGFVGTCDKGVNIAGLDVICNAVLMWRYE